MLTIPSKRTDVPIFAVMQPGGWIADTRVAPAANAPRATWHQAGLLVMAMHRTLHEANLALALYPEARARARRERDERFAQIEAPPSSGTALRDLSGLFPQELSQTEQLIFGRAYLFALDTFGKLLDKLIEEPGAPGGPLEACKVTFFAAFPDLIESRNSAHHLEDRLRWLGRKKGQGNAAIPATVPMMTDCVTNGHLTWTLHDGTTGQVPFTADALCVAFDVMQSVVNAFTWYGSPERVPR